MKKFLCVLALALCTMAVFAAEVEASIVLTKVEQKKGSLFVAIYDSSESMKKNKPVASFKVETIGETVTVAVILPIGEYYVSAYQDINNNGKLDTNLIGIPKEPVGIANYSGSGIPGGFDKHKVLINTPNQIIPVVMNKI